MIRTTTEYPFWVKDRGWVEARLLEIDDLPCSEEGRWLPVEDLVDTGDYAPVYNMRVADYHTYFVPVRRIT